MESQAKISKCISCGGGTNQLLCAECAADPYLIEKARKNLAVKNDLEKLSFLYSSHYPSLVNINNQRFWDKHFQLNSSIYSQDRMTQEKIKRITTLIPKKRLKLLDLGFGQGYIEEFLEDRKRDLEIYGVDISKAAVKRARKKFIGKFIHGNILQLKKSYTNNFFDLIVAIEVIEHISPHNVLKFYRDIYSLLKPKGILIISTPLNEHLKDKKGNPSGHVRDYYPEVVIKEMEISGFKTTDIHFFHAFKNLYFLKSFISKILPNRWEYNNIVVKAEKI